MSEVLTERDGAVLTITLNRPEVFNALNGALHAACGRARGGGGPGGARSRDHRRRARLLLRPGPEGVPGRLGLGPRPLEQTYHPNIRLIRALEKPVIAAVNGPCAGAGLSLAAACDLRIASDAATFVPGFIGIGLIPDSGGSWFIHRLLGFARAFDWMTTNKRLTAAEAHAWGLVAEVVEADRLAAHVAEVAGNYATLPTRAIGMTKRLFDHAYNATLEEQLALEGELQQEATGTADFAEGVTAFLEKREPRFTGN